MLCTWKDHTGFYYEIKMRKLWKDDKSMRQKATYENSKLRSQFHLIVILTNIQTYKKIIYVWAITERSYKLWLLTLRSYLS